LERRIDGRLKVKKGAKRAWYYVNAIAEYLILRHSKIDNDNLRLITQKLLIYSVGLTVQKCCKG